MQVAWSVQPTQGPDQIFHHPCLLAKKAMPLTRLRFYRFSGKNLGLESLQHASEHLPHLVELGTFLDSSLPYTDTLDLDDSSMSPASQGHPMTVLAFMDTRKECLKPREHRLIALFFNHIFPNLEHMEVVVAVNDVSLVEGWELIEKDHQRLGGK